MKLEGLPQKKLNLEIKTKNPTLMGFLFVIKNSECDRKFRTSKNTKFGFNNAWTKLKTKQEKKKNINLLCEKHVNLQTFYFLVGFYFR